MAEKETREPTLVVKHCKEYNRIMFSLKMALRMSNGIFDVFEVHKFGQRGINFEEEHEKTTIDCWYVPKSPTDERQIFEQQALYMRESCYEEFKTGSIVSREEDIPLGAITTFFIFKVVIGRSYVRKRSKMQSSNRIDRMQPPEGYDSVYIVEDLDEKRGFEH